MAIGLADAALEVIERGDELEMKTIRAAGWELAPNAFDRILKIVERSPRTLSKPWLVELYGALLEMQPTDARVLAAFSVDAHSTGAPPALLELAAQYNPKWLAEQLSSLTPPVDSDMHLWLWSAPESSRPELLTAIARLGAAYIESLISEVRAMPPISRVPLTHALEAQPEFAHYLDPSSK
jgi:hypothetical protein